MPSPSDDGGHLIEMHVTVDLQGVLTLLYTCVIRQERAFLRMQHLSQSKLTSRSLQGQNLINSNKKIYTSQATLSTSGWVQTYV